MNILQGAADAILHFDHHAAAWAGGGQFPEVTGAFVDGGEGEPAVVTLTFKDALPTQAEVKPELVHRPSGRALAAADVEDAVYEAIQRAYGPF